jgi:hypothetical protein
MSRAETVDKRNIRKYRSSPTDSLNPSNLLYTDYGKCLAGLLPRVMIVCDIPVIFP